MWPVLLGPSSPAVVSGVGGVVQPWKIRQDGFPSIFLQNGVKIGDTVESRPELDVAFVQLTPSNVPRFSNHIYFQAEPPRQLVGGDEIIQGL
jgi:hypothetical protein